MTDDSARLQPLARTEEQQALRDIARKFLADRLPTTVVRELMTGDAGFDPAHWSEAAGMGWQAMVVPEELGGAGYGFVELSVLFEELGRAVAPLPLLSTTMGTAALLAFGTDEQRSTHLPGVAAGEQRVTVALPVDDRRPGLVDGRLSGTVAHVLDASADLLVVPTQDRAVVLRGTRDGITRQRLDVLDPTRPAATVSFDSVAVADDDVMAGTATELEDHVSAVGAVMLSSEQVGVADAVHEMAVGYAKVRRQFGRAIGSFQAIKHLLADDLVRLESARSVAWHAARALAADDRAELAIAAPMAKSLCSEVALKLAGDNIQVHGGIGFTWEHDAHLYFKRASASKLLLGSPHEWRRRLATTLAL